MFACVGGGGLLSGIAAYIKALRPEIKVIGVEADDAAGMLQIASNCVIKILTCLPIYPIYSLIVRHD